MKRCSLALVGSLVAGYLLFNSAACAGDTHGGGRVSSVLQTNRDSIAAEMQHTLDEEFARWYPASIDTVYGGYLSDFNYAWEPDGKQNKMIVTQARHIWSTSNAALFYEKNAQFREIAAHGVGFLKDNMWDAVYGGYYELVDRRGVPIEGDGPLVKTAYGNAFAIYGLAAYYGTTGDTAVLHMAQHAFRWFEQHSYDSRFGGYFQFLSRDGTPFTEGYQGTPPKDYNSLIHILECYTELYRVWKDPLLHDRLFSLFHLIRDTVTTEKGYLKLYFNRDWTQAATGTSFEFDHVSFGHDVETAYLMREASEALGIRNDTTTLRIAKKMVDHALENGWDAVHGGLYDGGSYARGGAHAAIVKDTKEWWAQVEAFNAFLMMADLFPNDSHKYFEKFCEQWRYCSMYLIDHEHGGWYWGGTDIVPSNVKSVKGSIWKGNYHTSRALINCIRRLRASGTKTK
jgi:cellobiose epimerase